MAGVAAFLYGILALLAASKGWTILVYNVADNALCQSSASVSTCVSDPTKTGTYTVEANVTPANVVAKWGLP